MQYHLRLTCALLACVGPAMAQTYQQGTPIIGGHQATVNESSGVCRASQAGYFWTHGDSGGKNQIYRFGKDGKVVQSVTINGVKNLDWEDITSVKVKGKFYIIIGEIGNNGNKNSVHGLIVINDPASSATSQNCAGIVNFMWSDKKQHECEAMAVDPNGVAYIISEENKNSSLLDSFTLFDSAGRPKNISASSPVVAVKATSSKPKLNYISGADISSDGLKMVYTNIPSATAYEIKRSSMSSPWNFDNSTAINLGGVGLMREGICYDFDQKSICSTSEVDAWFVADFKYKYSQVFFIKR